MRNETAGGANAIPNRGVMRIGRFWCREITYRPLVSTLERLWLYQWFAGETFSRERRRYAMDCFEAPRMGLNLIFIKVSAAPTGALGPWKVEEP